MGAMMLSDLAIFLGWQLAHGWTTPTVEELEAWYRLESPGS